MPPWQLSAACWWPTEYGIKAWLTQALGGLFSNHSPLLFVAMTVLITLLLTNFFSNTATLLDVSSLVSALTVPWWMQGMTSPSCPWPSR